MLYFVSHAFCNEIDIVIEQLTRRFPPEDHKKTFGAHARAADSDPVLLGR